MPTLVTAAAWPFPLPTTVTPVSVEEWDGIVATTITANAANPRAAIPARRSRGIPTSRATRTALNSGIQAENAGLSADTMTVFVGPPLPNTVEPWPEITATTETALAYTMGIELTMIPEVLKGNSNNYDGGIASNYASIMDKIIDRDKHVLHYADPHRDQMAVEVPSKPLKKWGEAKKFYDTYSKIMLDIGLLPHHPKIASGGGHIHVGPLKTNTIVNILRDVQNKPWLMWTFNEPDDDTSASSFTEDIEGIDDDAVEAARTINVDPGLFSNNLSDEGRSALLYFANPKFVKGTNWFPTSKNNVLRYASSQKTLEFRMFEAPADWAEQEAHIRFVEKYVAWIEKTYKTTSPSITITKQSQLNVMKVGECEAEFRALLTTIGLPHAPYERFIKENLHFRFKRGNRV